MIVYLLLLLGLYGVKAVILPVDKPREIGKETISDMLEMLTNGQAQLSNEGISFKTVSRKEALSDVGLFFVRCDMESYGIHKQS